MIAAWLPRFHGVVAIFFLLNPYICFREKIDAAHVVPMSVTDDDVRYFLGLHAGQLYGFVGAEVAGRWEIFEESIAMVAAVEKNGVASAAD